MLRRHSKNSLWMRLMRSFFIVIFIPVVFLGGFIMLNTVLFVQQEKQAEVKQTIKQNVLDLNNRMEQCENSLIYVASNYSLQQFMQMSEASPFEIIQASKSVGPLLYNTMLSNQYYSKIRVYTNQTFAVMNDLFKSSEEVSDMSWYQETLKTDKVLWWFDAGRMFMSKSIITSYPKNTLGVLYVEIKNSLLDTSFEVFQDTPVDIYLDGSNVFRNSYHEKGKFPTIHEETAQLRLVEWEVIYRFDRQYFFPIQWLEFVFPTAVIISVLVMAAITVRIMLRVLLNEMNSLVEKVNEVKKGNLDVVIEPVKTEEINILVESVNNMLTRIRQLIQKAYISELEKKNLEIEILRSKINPHFLYNNLSAINWLAIEQGQDKIYEITTQMAMFYRTALNKGNNIDTLSIEISNIKAYINLQRISHEDSFRVEYDIDEEVLNGFLPIFIMQPLVENAIEHGLDLLRSGDGLLRIVIKREEEDILIKIIDNGTDLFDKIGEAVLSTSQYGYGTSNVHKRIQLIFGDDYGLQILATKNGTISVITIKYIDDVTKMNH